MSPSAQCTAFRGLYGERIKVSLSAPPEDNRANEELLKVLSSWLGLPRDRVRLQAGHASRDKTVVFTGVEEKELRKRLADLTSGTRPSA